MKATLKTWAFWRRSLIDAIVTGGLAGLLGTGGLAVSGKLEADWMALAILFGAGALAEVSKFWKAHPLSSVGAASMLACCVLFGLSGCKTFEGPPRDSAFTLGGYKAASEVMEHHARNIEVVEAVDRAIDISLAEDGLLFEAVETWYADQRQKIDLPEIEKMMLEQVVIVPLWQELKAKYGGARLSFSDPRVVADIRAFQRGLRRAIAEEMGYRAPAENPPTLPASYF